MRDPEERDASLGLRAAHGNRVRKAVGWYRTHNRVHTGDQVAMAADALNAYLTDRNAGKDALLVCDSWEMADALNRRLHDTLTSDGPKIQVARDQAVRVGDIIVSRHNDSRIPVIPAPGAEHADAEQVRNGNRWRIAGIDEHTNRIAAERLTDHARVLFHHDYLREHVSLGYAVTVHAAQGVTADTSHAVFGETAGRALAYVGLSRGRDANHAYIYTQAAGEGDHEHTSPVAGQDVHVLRRGSSYSAAHYLRAVLARDERPRTMHAEAVRADPGLLPDIINGLLQRHEERRAARAAVWREHTAGARAFQAGYERIADAAARGAERSRQRGLDVDGLEL